VQLPTSSPRLVPSLHSRGVGGTDQLDELERVAADLALFAGQEVQAGEWVLRQEGWPRAPWKEVLLECKSEVEIIATAIHDWAKDAVRGWQIR